MRLTCLSLLAMTLMAPMIESASAQTPAPPPPAGPIHIANYIEVAVASAKQGATLLKQYRDAARKEDGNQRIEVAQEIGRGNRFVVLEIWKDNAAFEAHGKSAATAALRDKMKAIQHAPFDERVHGAFAVGANEPIKAKRAVYVASHVDVPPPRREDLIAILNPLAADSRKGDGNLRFEAVQQTNRPNHFTVVEVWKDQKAYDARGAASPQKAFRDKLGPMLGALYDERLYRAID